MQVVEAVVGWRHALHADKLGVLPNEEACLMPSSCPPHAPPHIPHAPHICCLTRRLPWCLFLTLELSPRALPRGIRTLAYCCTSQHLTTR